jgi:hypothetical protein
MIESYEDGYPSGVSLSLGDSVALGRSRPDAAAARAVRKKGGRVVFALEAVDWPEDLAGAFAAGTAAIPDGTAVVRYDEGAVTNVRANFDWGAFDVVALHFERKFGPPIELRERRDRGAGLGEARQSHRGLAQRRSRDQTRHHPRGQDV